MNKREKWDALQNVDAGRKVLVLMGEKWTKWIKIKATHNNLWLADQFLNLATGDTAHFSVLAEFDEVVIMPSDTTVTF